MNRITLSSLTLGVVLVLVCGGAAMAADIFSNDFSKDLGNWKVVTAEGKTGSDGLTLTKFEQYGGICIDIAVNKGEDISNAKTVTVELQNTGDSELKLAFKIGSGNKKVTKDFSVEAGKTFTYKYPLSASDVDLTKVNYMRVFSLEATADGKLVVKKVALVMKGESGSKPVESKPAATKPVESAPASKPAAKVAVLEMADGPVLAATKPAETKPATSKPATSKPAETKPVPAPVVTGANPYNP